MTEFAPDFFTLTTPRAILDWNRRPTDPGTTGVSVNPSGRTVTKTTPVMAGVVGATKFRLTWQLDERLAAALIAKCETALADPDIHDAQHSAITATRLQVQQALTEWRQIYDGR